MNSKYIIPCLTQQQKETARRILEKESCYNAVSILSEPPPRGIGLEMSRPTVSRLKQRLDLEAQLAEMQDVRPQASAIATEKSLGDLHVAALVLLKEKAFQLALSNDPVAIDLSCRIVRNLARVQQPASLPGDGSDSEALRLNVASMILNHHAHIESIRCKPGLDFDQKVRLLSNKLLELAD